MATGHKDLRLLPEHLTGGLVSDSEKGGAKRVPVPPCFPGQFPRAKMIILSWSGADMTCIVL